jgi:hypothetical protein
VTILRQQIETGEDEGNQVASVGSGFFIWPYTELRRQFGSPEDEIGLPYRRALREPRGLETAPGA